MNVAEINPLKLPSLPLADRRSLPNCPAIYFVLEGTRVLYIGRAENLQQRWAAHHRYNLLKTITNVHIAWLECTEPRLLPKIESALIEEFRPSLNGVAVAGDYISLRIFMPELLRNEFKAVCARQGRNMSEVVTDFVKKYVAEYGMLPYSADRPSEPPPPDPQPTETKSAIAAKAKRGKAGKSAS